jgi:drug/metabolite transporter superfamily protein YnfA
VTPHELSPYLFTGPPFVMNQFRDIMMMAMIILAVGITVSDPEGWTWAAAGGAYVVNALHFLAATKPWSVVILLALSLALFMTRIKF